MILHLYVEQLGSNYGHGILASGDDVIVTRTAGAGTTITVALTDSADPILHTTNLVYTCQVNNTTGNAASSVSVSLTLDANCTYVSSAGSGWSIGVVGQVVTATRASIAGSSNSSFTVTCSLANDRKQLSSSASASASNASLVSDGETTEVVSQDGPGNWWCPESAAATAIIPGWPAGRTPSGIYDLQQASGDATDKVGSLTLTAVGDSPMSYQQTIAGWNRKAVSFSSLVNHQGFSTSSQPDLSVNSVAALVFLRLNEPGGLHIYAWGPGSPDTANQVTFVQEATDSVINRCCNASGGGTTQPVDVVDGSILAILTVYNRANSTSTTYIGDASSAKSQKMVALWSAGLANGNFGLGGFNVSGSVQPASMDAFLLYTFFGTNAEFTEQDAYDLFGALNIDRKWGVPFDGAAPYVYVPSTATHFSRLELPQPVSVWTFQEASGNLIGSGGTANFDLPLSVTPNYTRTVANWLRKFISYDSNTGDGHQAPAGTGPNPATTSVLWIGYVVPGVTASNTALQIMSACFNAAATQFSLILHNVAGTVTWQGKDCANTADGSSTNVLATVDLVMLMLDRTNSRAVFSNSGELIKPTYNSGVADGSKGYGGKAAVVSNAAFSAGLGWVWAGSDAEKSDGQLRSIYQTLRFSPAW